MFIQCHGKVRCIANVKKYSNAFCLYFFENEFKSKTVSDIKTSSPRASNWTFCFLFFLEIEKNCLNTQLVVIGLGILSFFFNLWLMKYYLHNMIITLSIFESFHIYCTFMIIIVQPSDRVTRKMWMSSNLWKNFFTKLNILCKKPFFQCGNAAAATSFYISSFLTHRTIIYLIQKISLSCFRNKKSTS